MNGNKTYDFWSRFAKPSLFQRIIIFILVFFQFYPTKFLFLPFSVRVFISFLGAGLLIYRYLADAIMGRPIFIDRRFIYLLAPLLFITIFSALSLNYNGTMDKEYLFYFTTSFLMLSSAYFIVSVMQWAYKDRLSFEIIAYYCILAVFVQLIFGILSYVSPSLVMPLILKTEEGFLQLDSTNTVRFIGFGAFFMNLGVANGVGLLLIAVLLKNAKYYSLSPKISFWLGFLFVLIAALGNMQARTSTICTAIALSYLCFSSFRLNINRLKSGIGKLIMVLVIFALLLLTVLYFFKEDLKQYQGAIDYGFELFNSINQGKGAQTRSSNMLQHMLTVWPTTTKTWLIGDGIYSTSGGNYYMETDVGYIRLIFYFGIFGMASFYVYEIMVTYFSFRGITKFWKPVCVYLILMILIINIKAFEEYTLYVAPFFVFNLLYHKEDNAATLSSPEIQSDKKL